MSINLPLIAVVEARANAAQIKPADAAAPKAAPKSSLIADCTETSFVPSPLGPRPTLRRATLASHPARPHRHRKVAHKAKKPAVHRKHHAVRHRAHRRHPIAHRGPAGPTRAVLRKVTYASPLCGERTQAINDMIGLPDNVYDVTQAPVAALPADVQNQLFVLPALVGGGGTPGPSGPVIDFPAGPGFPGGPTGPIVIIGPPVGPGGPDTGGGVTTPPTPPVASPAPEAESWMMMLAGLGLVGGAMRRGRMRERPRAI